MNKKYHLIIMLCMSLFLVQFAMATDVAYVLKNTFSPEQEILDSLDSLGLDYDLIDDSEVSITNFSEYGLILLGDENINNVPVNSYKSLILDFDYRTGWADRSGYTTYNSVYNLDNDITEGQGEFVPYTESGHTVYYLSYRKYSTALTVKDLSTSGKDKFVVAQKDNPRRILFGITEPEYWSAGSKTLFENSLIWVLKGGDNDGDGFLQGDDCDDSDPNVNPGSTDLSKNCKNDAPVFQNFQTTTTINKNENVTLTFEATDPENDALTYNISDPRFVKTSSQTFTWTTKPSAVGNYAFTASVSDGKIITKKSFTITIKNRAPNCNVIPDLVWDEDGEATLDLNDYCDDLDEDNLNFDVEETSSNVNIMIKSFFKGIITFFSTGNWFGEDWVVFSASDTLSETETNNVTLIVRPVNDRPKLNNQSKEITLAEDKSINIDIAKYFDDIDSELEYTVEGNSNLTIEINGDEATLTPEKDWFGEEDITFIASDGEFQVETQKILVKVYGVNDAPTFVEPLNCKTEILEDTEYKCTVGATDIEGDNLEISIVTKNKLDCSLNGNTLTYKGQKDYFGEADCGIRVTDKSLQSTLEFKVNIENVNDGPFIKTYSPTTTKKMIVGEKQNFSVQVNDLDNSELDFTWSINNEPVSGAKNKDYIFSSQERGNFTIKIIVSDGNLTDSIEWNLEVGEMSDFKCSEVKGFIFKETEMCRGEILGVSDTTRCCSIKGTYSFDDIENRCETLSKDLEIDIRSPKDGDDFLINENLEVTIVSRHNYNDDGEFEINTYLYDTTEDKVLEELEEEVEIGRGDSELLELNFGEIQDMNPDFDNDYTLFTMIRDLDTGSCQEDYIKIDVERNDHEVIIDSASLKNKRLTCGEEILFSLNIENIGSSDEDIFVVIESPELDIQEELEEFELESEDSEKITYNDFQGLYVPEDTRNGQYEIDFDVYYDDRNEYATERSTITVEGCNENNAPQEDSGLLLSKTIEPTTIEGKENSQSATDGESGPKMAVMLLIGLIFLLAFVIIQFALKLFVFS